MSYHHLPTWVTPDPEELLLGHPGMQPPIPSRSRRASARILPATSALRNQRGRRECRAPGAPAASRVEKNTRVSHHGHTGNTRHSPRNGFNGFLRALPGDRAFLPTSPAKITFRELDARVGASGPPDFSVRFSTVRYRRFHVHRILPRVRDDREPPLCGTGRRECASDLGFRKTRIFFQ